MSYCIRLAIFLLLCLSEIQLSTGFENVLVTKTQFKGLSNRIIDLVPVELDAINANIIKDSDSIYLYDGGMVPPVVSSVRFIGKRLAFGR